MNRLLKIRILKDRAAAISMRLLTLGSLLLLFLIGAGLLFKSIPILETHSVSDLLFGKVWKPMKGLFGFYPFILGTISVTFFAVVLSLPISLLSSIYITENAKDWVKRLINPILDILAGIPSVVYGVWATLIIVPWISDTLAPAFGIYTSGYTILAGAIVLAVMITPVMISLFVEIIAVVPKELKDASISLGATRWQTSRKVVIRKALPGIIAAIVLAVSKAFGETIAVLMVCGNITKIPHSIFDGAYPLTALIANNYGEMLSVPQYESALMFGALILFVIILLFNTISRIMLQKIERRFKL